MLVKHVERAKYDWHAKYTANKNCFCFPKLNHSVWTEKYKFLLIMRKYFEASQFSALGKTDRSLDYVKKCSLICILLLLEVNNLFSVAKLFCCDTEEATQLLIKLVLFKMGLNLFAV